MRFFTLILSIISLLCVVSCTDSIEGNFTTSPSALLTFEQDTLRFDTVFTTIGSSTQRFKIYNHNKKDLRIRQVKLGGGHDSQFRINLDGQYLGSGLTDVEIMGNDSLFLFCEVTVKPHDSDAPILLRDSLQFVLESGVLQQMILEAYGQDIIVLKAPVIESNTTLDANRPYLVYDSLVVKKDVTLTMAAGTTFCFYSGASLMVHGTWQANGTLEQPVTLRGHRTDRIFSNLTYDNMDAQWGGVTIFPESKKNVLQYTDLHAASWGINIENTDCTIENSIIHNVRLNGIYAKYAKLHVSNSQITNAGNNCVSLVGGTHHFVHTTIAQFYPWKAGAKHALSFTNLEDSVIYPLHQAIFENCLITGYNKDEIQGTSYTPKEGETLPSEAEFNASFKGCLVNIDLGDAMDENDAAKAARQMFTTSLNETEAFHQKKKLTTEQQDSIVWGKKNFVHMADGDYLYDFRLDSVSQARGIGLSAPAAIYPLDRLGKPRPSNKPDVGCYQYQAILKEDEKNK